MARAERCLKTPGSRSRALLVRVTLADQRRLAAGCDFLFACGVMISFLRMDSEALRTTPDRRLRTPSRAPGAGFSLHGDIATQGCHAAEATSIGEVTRT